MFRLLFLTFNGSFRGTQHQADHLHESPIAMTVPLIILAVLSIIGGFAGIPEIFAHGQNHIADFLKPVVVEKPHGEISHSTEYALMALATGLVLIAIAFAWFKNKNYKTQAESTGLGKVLENKWYVDELYDNAVVKPLSATGGFFNNIIEKVGLDGAVNGVGKFIHAASRQLRLLQSGQIGVYILLMIVGVIIAIRMGVYIIDFSWLSKIF